jgi:hypothetical protein
MKKRSGRAIEIVQAGDHRLRPGRRAIWIKPAPPKLRDPRPRRRRAPLPEWVEMGLVPLSAAIAAIALWTGALIYVGLHLPRSGRRAFQPEWSCDESDVCVHGLPVLRGPTRSETSR